MNQDVLTLLPVHTEDAKMSRRAATMSWGPSPSAGISQMMSKSLVIFDVQTQKDTVGDTECSSLRITQRQPIMQQEI